MAFWKKSSSLSSEGICEVLRFYPEVCVQRVSCLSMEIASSMLVPEFIVCRQTSCFMYCIDGFRDISLICSRAVLVDLHLMVCLCFFCKSSSLASEGICEVLRVYSEVRVQRLCCLSMEITNSMLFPGFMVCGHTLFYVVD